jgi:hypothetical protein
VSVICGSFPPTGIPGESELPRHDTIAWSVIQLTKQGLAGSVDIAELGSQFERSHVFRLPGLLDPNLMQIVSSRLESCIWITHDDGKIAREAVPESPTPGAVLNYAANTAGFLDVIRSVTRCHRITWFGGRIYRMAPATDHFDSWHSDIGSTHQDRLVGMSINLGSSPYQGGTFRLRDEASGTVLCELPNTNPGDAIFFRISPALEHMVTALWGNEPKTAFAGWFHTGDKHYYGDLLRAAQS